MVRKVPRDERRQRVVDALAMVRLDGYERRRPSQLSGGQRQRVALARALVNRPRVLLLDEPLGALDLKLREEMQIELKAIQREVGITFIYVTHDQEEALTMSDRLAVFNHGRIEQVGTPGRRLREARHPLRRRLRRHLATSCRGSVAQAIVGREGTFTVRPEKIRLEAPDGPVGRRRDDGARAASPRSSTSAPTRATSCASTPARRWSSRSRTCPRRRPRRSPSRAARSGSSGSGSTASPSAATGEHAERRRTRMKTRHLAAAIATVALVVGACGGGATSAPTAPASATASAAPSASAAATAAPTPAPDAVRLGVRVDDPAQAGTSTWPGRRPGRGRAQPHHLGRLRRGRLERQGVRLGHAVRGGDRLQGQRRRSATRPTRW